MNNLAFNPSPSTIMHIDLNSCFATIEQQANPHLRGKPIAVAAYTTPFGCILAPSIEAKSYGIQTGMRVKDGKALCPKLIVLPPDPWKYRNVHLALRKILKDYTNDLNPKSIDEFVLNMKDYLLLLREPPCKVVAQSSMHRIALEIKQRIKREIGEWLTVSVGIAPNRFLAKLASQLKKPDGLEEINKDNFLNHYLKLKLTDLPYIKARNAIRLNSVGIFSVLDFYQSPIWKLKAAFKSILGYYWYVRLHGYELDDVVFGRRSYGNSYAFPKPLITPEQIAPILTKLVEKMGFRLRRAGYKARGVHLAVTFRDAPEVRDFLGRFMSTDVQCAMGGEVGSSRISPNVDVGPDCYANPILADASAVLTDALASGTGRFDASDMMPPAVGSGSFWTGMVEYMQGGPDSLSGVLDEIEASWPAE